MFFDKLSSQLHTNSGNDGEYEYESSTSTSQPLFTFEINTLNAEFAEKLHRYYI